MNGPLFAIIIGVLSVLAIVVIQAVLDNPNS
jgi:hypothetical protein